MTSEPIALPAPPPPVRRPPVPFVAALVPIAAGVLLWLVTGSVLSLCFAFLGPLMICGSLLDGLRHRRRETRQRAAESDLAWERVEEEVALRRRVEREQLWQRNPDVAACLSDEPLHPDDPVDASTTVVIGRGEHASAIRFGGGDDQRGREVRRRYADLDDAPVAVALGRGICVRAPRHVATAIVRALIVQICMRHLPGRVVLVGDQVEGQQFAHSARRAAGAWRIAVVLGRDAQAPPADSVIWICAPGDSVPESITTVLDCVDPAEATVRTADATHQIVAECLSAHQFAALAESSMRDAAFQAELPHRVSSADLEVSPRGAGLVAMIGRSVSADIAVDLVSEGPHAIVTGMTGVGKSELLVTWVASIAAGHTPEEVMFVLADFKGGTAFDPLAALPHVTAVLTDLDDAGARRGVESLTAELRRRERVLAAAGARDVDGPGVGLPRLVIVVDEFAALLQEHPDLASVFTDIAARGRALGMHLVIGTQRAAGVIRDALAANCPLRISLRVAEAADSRMVIGTDDASALEGGRATRGIAFLRRPQDSEPVELRVALTPTEEIDRLTQRWRDQPRASGPWLPALPALLPLESLAGEARTDALLLGRADEPEHQRQPVVALAPKQDRGMAVVGGPGAGKTAVLRLLQQQDPHAIVVPADPERAWDLVETLAGGGGAADGALLCDDLDRLLSAYPPDYALAFAERFEQVVRAAQDRLVVIAFSRVTGQSARVAEALQDRLLLRSASRSDHIAAGGESANFLRDRAPGRGHFRGHEVQVAWTTGRSASREQVQGQTTEHGADTGPWTPERNLVAVVGNVSARLLEHLRGAFPAWEVRAAGAGTSGAPGGIDRTPLRGQIVVGDADTWQRDWTLWQRARSDGEVLVLAECAVALRTLAGVRELPPYARLHSGRAWRLVDGLPPVRVVLPAEAGPRVTD